MLKARQRGIKWSSSSMPDDKRIYLFDTTLRDGPSTQGSISTYRQQGRRRACLDKLVSIIRDGWPGANPTDDAFSAGCPYFRHASLVAFGMTRRPGCSAANDPGWLLNASRPRRSAWSGAWDFHVDVALGDRATSNVDMIGDRRPCQGTRPRGDVRRRAFLRWLKANPQYALDCAMTAYKAGARWIVLTATQMAAPCRRKCRIVGEVAAKIPGRHLGIHAHNDTENAVANSLAAVHAGARQIQGTLNGLGERCGNANLISCSPR